MSVAKKIRLVLGIIAAVLLLASCARNFDTQYVAGEWHITAESDALLNEKSQARFRIEPGGSFLATNLPSTAFGDHHPWLKRYTGVGTWVIPRVSRLDQFAVLVLQFDSTGAGQPTGLGLQIDRDSDGIYVFLWLGEEGGDRLVFRRRPFDP